MYIYTIGVLKKVQLDQSLCVQFFASRRIGSKLFQIRHDVSIQRGQEFENRKMSASFVASFKTNLPSLMYFGTVIYSRCFGELTQGQK
jgi:hypothetical protein